MGHGSSRSMALEPPPLFSCSPKKYGHRVLPLPSAGRNVGRRGLRTTDNGSALHTAGTIRGGAMRTQQRTEGRTAESFTNLRNHRMFHSDPNIARRDDTHGGGYANRRSCGGGASRVKCAKKKKSHAPPPPPNTSAHSAVCASVPERRSGGEGRAAACKCIVAKTRAPPPPVAFRAPPPPLPEVLTTSASSSIQSPGSTRDRSETGRRRPLGKCEEDPQLDGCRRVGGGRPPDDPFQEEIRVVTRKIARMHRQEDGEKKKGESPPKFFFADPGGVFLKRSAESQNGRREVDVLRTRSPAQQQQQQERDIDVRLRPVLPRKPLEMPKFSSFEAWRALGSDGLGSRSSSDYSLAGTRRRLLGRAVLSDTHWTPRQDLSDDVGSDDSEEAVVPRTRGEIARFSLPTIMFSNIRPIGTRSSTPAEVKRADDRFHGSAATDAASESNWTFGQSGGLQKRGRQFSSELLLSSKKSQPIKGHNPFGDFLLGDILMSNSNYMRRQMKSSTSGNSNFSFYSTDCRVEYAPVRKRAASPPSTRGIVFDMRRRFDANLAAKRKAEDVEAGRRRGEELARVLEDEVRRRRNEEKVGIRQQLRKMKRLCDEEDEAYFTEPKSREEEEVPFSFGGLSPFASTSRLSHWQSSPALLEDSSMKSRVQLAAGRSSSAEEESRHSEGASAEVSSSTSPARHRRRKNSGGGVYQQLMEIVRKEEERQWGGATRSRGSSHRSSSSSSSSSDSGRRWIPPPPPPLFRSFAQPNLPRKSLYRPVPFDTGGGRLLPRV